MSFYCWLIYILRVAKSFSLSSEALLKYQHQVADEVGLPWLYVYCLEANLTFNNGLCIPIMSEFLYRHHNELDNKEGKQDCELAAFERL